MDYDHWDDFCDEELDDNFTVFLASNLDRGNYTHYIYEEYNGTLIQNGSFYSYGNSTTTSDEDSDEWFEDWDYETEDTNDDEVANKITIYFNPDTDCNCSTDVYVGMDIYNNDTNNYIYHDSINSLIKTVDIVSIHLVCDESYKYLQINFYHLEKKLHQQTQIYLKYF